jgi:ectoine hydroxylase-related dioxygenase (phytanoyl-CoA dioxygenase family)
VPDVLSRPPVISLPGILDEAGRREGISRSGGILAVRNPLEVVPEIAALAKEPAVRSLVEPVIGVSAFAVRGILFDKTPQTNWKVTWHQDLTIAVKQKIDVPGFGPWSEKAGVASVQPPVSFLDQMLTVRINLDDCTDDNGPVRVIPGSHRAWRAQGIEQTTAAPQGAALLMRPLLLHASSSARLPEHRRVIHIDFAASELPGGLRWYTRVSDTRCTDVAFA